MIRTRTTVVSLVAATLLGLLLTATPAAANHPYSRARIGDVYGNAYATATSTSNLVTMRALSTSSYQVWSFTETSVGVRVTNLATGGCLAPPRSWTGTNPPVHQHTCTGSYNERWQLVATTSTTWAFRNVGMQGRCMSVNRNYSPPRLFLVSCSYGSPSQQFRLRAA